MLKATKAELLFDCTCGFDAWMRYKTKGDPKTTITANGKSVVVTTDYGCKKVRTVPSP